MARETELTSRSKTGRKRCQQQNRSVCVKTSDARVCCWLKLQTNEIAPIWLLPQDNTSQDSLISRSTFAHIMTAVREFLISSMLNKLGFSFDSLVGRAKYFFVVALSLDCKLLALSWGWHQVLSCSTSNATVRAGKDVWFCRLGYCLAFWQRFLSYIHWKLI